MTLALDHNRYYRLPWNLPDNAISWLEVTKACNLHCEGCYRENSPSHKSLDAVKHDLAVFRKYRKTDGVSIAGGDPLVHPEIVEIVRLVAQEGLKPILNTNGLALTRELLRDLKKAGVAGFTFHVDSKQHRPYWRDKNEIELNALRLTFAEMLAQVGGLSCAFNSTVYADTLQYVPDILAWAHEHIDIVHVVVFIAIRAAVLESKFDYYAGAEKVDMSRIVYSTAEENERLDISSNDVVEAIRARYPDFEPCAYLNGTEKPDAFKWLLAGRIGTKETIFGSVGPKFMELAQTLNHLRKGTYLAYTKPSVQRNAKAMLLLAPVDRGLRAIAGKYLGAVARNPLNLFRRLHLQSVTIIQPADVLCNGAMSMCDGCPDITVWNDELVWSCRLEEQMKFGCFVRAVPKAGTHCSN